MNKQETIEEAARKYEETFGLGSNGCEASDFIEGAKWQAENLVDLLERLTTIYIEGSDLHQKYDKQRLNFIEQFKKK